MELISDLIKGLKNFLNIKKQLVSFSAYALFFVSIAYFGDVKFKPNGQILAYIVSGAIFSSGVLICCALLKVDSEFYYKRFPKSILYKNLNFIFSLFYKTLLKYFIIAETGIGLLLLYALIHKTNNIYTFIVFILYIYLGSLIEASKYISSKANKN